MSNMKKVDLDNNNNGKQKLVDADGAEMEVDAKAPEELMYEPHPNNIFAARVERKKLSSGLYLPEGFDDDKAKTPIVKVMAVGENVAEQFKNTSFSIEEGDLIYADPQFMRIAKIDGVVGVVLMADGIFGKVKQPE